MQYVLGILMIVFGTVLILKTEWFVKNFGVNAWAESKLGTSGGSRILYKFIGLIIIFFGLLITTNMIQGFLNATIVRLFVRQ